MPESLTSPRMRTLQLLGCDHATVYRSLTGGRMAHHPGSRDRSQNAINGIVKSPVLLTPTSLNLTVIQARRISRAETPHRVFSPDTNRLNHALHIGRDRP